MKLEFEPFALRLKSFDPHLQTVFHSREAASLTRMKEIHTFPADPHDNTVYVIRAGELPEKPPAKLPTHFCCIMDAAAPDWLRDADASFVMVDSAVTPEQVEQVVTEIHDGRSRFMSAMDELLDALYYGQGLQAIADITANLFGNPVYIVDTSLKALASSRDAHSDWPMIQANLDHDTLQFLRESGWLDAIRREGTSFFQSPEQEGPKYGWCHSLIKVNGVVTAYLTVFGQEKPIYDYQREWLSFISKTAAVEFQKNPQLVPTEGSMYEALLGDLLDGRITDQLVIFRRLKLVDRKIGKYMHVVTIRRLSDAMEYPFTPLDQSRMRDLFPGSLSVSYRKDIVLLAHSDDGSVPVAEDMLNVDSNLAASGLVAGVSNVFSDPTEMRRYYLQSVKALEFGKSIYSEGGISRYENYAIFHALELCTEKVDLRDLCHPGVLMLQESDNPADADLFQTLYLYLLYMKDVAKVSEALNIHRSTLFYRLNKIKSLIGVDFDDGNDVFSMMFSFKLIEYMDLFSPNESQLPIKNIPKKFDP